LLALVVVPLAVTEVVEHITVLCCVPKAVTAYNVVHVRRNNLIPSSTYVCFLGGYLNIEL
jgi:hypothetical protein